LWELGKVSVTFKEDDDTALKVLEELQLRDSNRLRDNEVGHNKKCK